MEKKKRIVLLSTLYYASESLVSRDLQMRLEEHIKDEVVTPDLLESKCFLIFDEPEIQGYYSDERKLAAIYELQRAFNYVAKYPYVMVEKAMKMKGILRGWKISRGHRRNKENKQ